MPAPYADAMQRFLAQGSSRPPPNSHTNWSPISRASSSQKTNEKAPPLSALRDFSDGCPTWSGISTLCLENPWSRGALGPLPCSDEAPNMAAQAQNVSGLQSGPPHVSSVRYPLSASTSLKISSPSPRHTLGKRHRHHICHEQSDFGPPINLGTVCLAIPSSIARLPNPQKSVHPIGKLAPQEYIPGSLKSRNL